MRIMIIGNSGTGKTTLSNKMARITDYPLLHLDSLWHITDYSDTAKEWFAQQQELFIKQPNWIIDGNYSGTMSLRIPQADVIIWLKLNRFRSIKRVLQRSLIRRLDRNSRSEMPSEFSEHFEFLKYVLNYKDEKIQQLIDQYKQTNAQVVVITNNIAKRKLLRALKKAHLTN